MLAAAKAQTAQFLQSDAAMNNSICEFNGAQDRTGVWQVQEADGGSDGKRLQGGGLRVNKYWRSGADKNIII